MKGWRHGGDIWEVSRSLGCHPREIIDFSSSINPFGPPKWVESIIDSVKPLIIHYPDPFCVRLRHQIARHYGIRSSEIVPGNGTSELLYLLPRAIRPKRVVVPVPSYVDYEHSARAADIEVIYAQPGGTNFQLSMEKLELNLFPGDLVVLGRPNNPTGTLVSGNKIRKLAKKNPGVIFVIDQAFYDFVDGTDPLIKDRPQNLMVLFSLTKILAIPGIRIGWLVGEERLLDRVRQVQAPWSVNVFAQAIGEKALEDRTLVEMTRRSIARARGQLINAINEIPGLHAYPSEANFLLVRIENAALDAIRLKELLLRYKIIIRPCGNFVGLDEKFFRISIRSEKDNERLVNVLKGVVGEYQ
ncbi:MAG: threonine-phosphate decarboxylase [Deltaproteobacteria bacterium]|nr:MAG: threonine-phosphate decarboxylase [Deltaproteobacteria bacterium]